MKRLSLGLAVGLVLGGSGFAIAGYPGNYQRSANGLAGIMPGGKLIVACLDRASGAVRPGVAAAPATIVMAYATGDGAWWHAQTLTCPG